MGAPTVAALAELRVRQGRLAEAEQLLVGREEHPESLRALAHLRLAQGRPQVAAALLERGLLAAEGDAMRTAQLLALLVDARLAEGETGAAEAAARRLAELAGRSGTAVVGARAELAAARTHVAAATGGRSGGGGPPGARRVRRARDAATRSAEARLELARALVDESPSSPSRRRAPPTRPSASSARRAPGTPPRRCCASSARRRAPHRALPAS